jgi:hypothetical protein
MAEEELRRLSERCVAVGLPPHLTFCVLAVLILGIFLLLPPLLTYPSPVLAPSMPPFWLDGTWWVDMACAGLLFSYFSFSIPCVFFPCCPKSSRAQDTDES